MIRRPLLASGILLASLSSVVATSCSTFTDNRTVASVNEHDLDQDELRDMLDSELGQNLLGSAPVDGQATGASVRSLITAWIVLTALDDAGTIDADARSAAEAAIVAQAGDAWDTTPAVLQQLAIQNVAIGTAIQDGSLAEEDFLALVQDADVEVDSYYGAWNADDQAVVAFG